MPESRHTLRLRGHGDLLEAVPYLLGFHPRESLVLMGLGQVDNQSQVKVTVRMDLLDAEQPAAMADVTAVLRRAGARAVVIVIYSDDSSGDSGSDFRGVEPYRPDRLGRPGHIDSLPKQEMVEGVRQRLDRSGFAVLDALLVSAGQWWSYLGHVGNCPCCSSGPRLPGDSSPIAATATFVGMVAHADRDALAAVLEPEDSHVRERQLPRIYAEEDAALQAALDGRAGQRQRSLKRAIFADAREADRTLIPYSAANNSDDVLCRHAVALGDVGIRDALWLAIDQSRLDGRAFWQLLARRLPTPYDCAPLFLFGWAAWREGNGSLAAMAAERALTSDPSYTAADLLLSAVRHGLDPFRTPRLRGSRPALNSTSKRAS